MDGILETIEAQAAAAYAAVRNTVTGAVASASDKIAEIKKLRAQFSAIYRDITATDAILNNAAARLTALKARALRTGTAGIYKAISNNQERLAENQTGLNGYINAAIKKYGEIITGETSLSDIGVLPVVVVGAIAVSTIAAIAALFAYLMKLVQAHKAEVIRQNAQITQYEGLLNSLENGKITPEQFQTAWAATGQSQPLNIMPILIVGGLIVGGLIFLNRSI